jgi:hypothetical protein
MKDCKQCHEEGYLGAPIPTHLRSRPSHIEKLSCESCHIPKLNRSAALGLETSTGVVKFKTKPAESGRFGKIAGGIPITSATRSG